MPFLLFQLNILTRGGASAPFSFTVAENNLIVLLILLLAGLILAILIVLNVIRGLYIRRGRASVAFALKVLMVRVPKTVKKEDTEQSKSTQQIQELISVMETIFSTLGSLHAQRGFTSWLFGRSDHFSFEIVMHGGKINFYVAVPEAHQHFIEEQIHAQFPNAQVDEVPDYNVFTPTGIVMGSYLKFRRSSIFPVKSYKKLETDPLNSLTNALSKIDDLDGGAIQFVIRPARSSWRREGLRIARAMQQGKKLSDVQNRHFFYGVGKELSKFADAGSTKEKKPEESYRLSPLEEDMVKGLEEKASKAGLDVNIRIVVTSKNQEKAKRYLNDILGSFGQYNIYEYGNSFVKVTPSFQGRLVRHFIYRHFDERYRIVLNAEELSSVYHFPLPTTETPKINWLLSRKSQPPSNLPKTGLLLGHSEFRGNRFEIRIKPDDRRRHMYIIGKSGSGKTEMMKAMVQQDIEEGRGVCIIDPHGDFADDALGFVPKERADDVIFFDPGDNERPMGLNMLEYDPRYPEQKTFVINEMLKIFDKLYDLKSTGGPMFEQYMRNAMILLMDHPESGSTLMEIPRVLADDEYRAFKLTKCKTPSTKDFWQKEAQKAGGEASLANMVPYITSKLTPFITNDYLRPIIGQQSSAFDIRDVMDSRKILLLKLSKGKIGDLNAYLVGMVLVGKILMAALARGDMPAKDRSDFYLYIDEFQNFLTESISSILSEARKYGLDLIIAHQFIGQLEGKGGDNTIRDAIFGNVGSMFVNRVGVEDAEFLAKEFAPVFTEYDLVNVEAFTFNAKILIENQASRPFNFAPIRARRPETRELADMIRELSRYTYGRKRELIEAEILERQRSVEEEIEDGDL